MAILKPQSQRYYKSKPTPLRFIHIVGIYQQCCRYITQESHKLEVQARPPIAVTNAVSWRSEGIRYRKNEVFLDVIESLNLLVSANGNVLRSEILGAIKMKCYLSGMPELRLGLNDKVMFETTGRATRGKAVEMEDARRVKVGTGKRAEGPSFVLAKPNRQRRRRHFTASSYIT